MDDPIIPDGGNQTAPESAYEVPEEVGAPLTPVRESSHMASENLEPVPEPADDVIDGAYGYAARPLDTSEEDVKTGSGELPMSDPIELHSNPEASGAPSVPGADQSDGSAVGSASDAAW